MKGRGDVHGGLVALIVLACVPGGCILQWPGTPAVSPDGRWVGYAFTDRIHIPRDLLSTYKIENWSVRWCRTDRTFLQGSVTVEPFQAWAGYDPQTDGMLKLAFSPDSQHLAVVSQNWVMIVQPRSGRHWKITPEKGGEYISSFCWVGADEFGYVGHSNIQDLHTGKWQTDRTFWRQRIHCPAEGRRAILRQQAVKVAPQNTWCYDKDEHWSPDGRYVVFLSAAYEGRLHLLDVASGKVKPFGEAGVYDLGVSWKPDGSAALCATRTPSWPPSKKSFGYLVTPGDGKVLDVSEEVTRLVGTRRYYVDNAFAPRWTADGKYVLVYHGKGEKLLQVDPWRESPLGFDRLDKDANIYSYKLAELAWWDMSARVTTVPGLLHAGDTDQKKYLLDYAGRRVQRIGHRGDSFTITPDGKLTTVTSLKTVHIRKLNLKVSAGASPAGR